MIDGGSFLRVFRNPTNYLARIGERVRIFIPDISMGIQESGTCKLIDIDVTVVNASCPTFVHKSIDQV